MHRVRAPGKPGDDIHDRACREDDRATEQESVVRSETSHGSQIPSFVFAGAPAQGRAVSPSLASNNSSVLKGAAPTQSVAGLLDASNNQTALLLLLRQQQEQLLQQQLLQQQQMQLKNQPQQLAEMLILQHVHAQQQQQQQQRNLQELLTNALGQSTVTQSPNITLDQGGFVQTLLAQLLQQQGPSNNVNDVNAALLAGLLR
jgi:hypothetical protein